MDDLWFEELKKAVMDFFENVTEEELKNALKDANYDLYKNITHKTIESYDLNDEQDV